MNQPITTQEHHAIDLKRCLWEKNLGDIRLYATWVWSDDHEDSEPCLIMLPRYRAMGKPCGVALSSAYLYNDDRYLVRAALEFAIEMGFGYDKSYIMKIATMIHEHLPDLVGMPPEPTTATEVADGTLTYSDGRTESIVLLDHFRHH